MKINLNIVTHQLFFADEFARERRLGEFVHLALYFIDSFDGDDQVIKEAVLRAFSLFPSHYLFYIKDSRETVYKLLFKALNYKEVKRFFRKDIRNYRELEILDSNGDSHRIDRLIIDKKENFILEYKLRGMKDKKKRKGHEDQVRLYMRLVEDTIGPARGFLFYLEDRVLFEVK